MKKTLSTLAILLGMTICATAQNGGGLFQRGSMPEDYNEYDRTTGGLILPSQHGQTGDTDAPVGSGIAVLVGLGAAYALHKRHKKPNNHHKLLAAMLTLAALTAGQSAWAQITWEVTKSTSGNKTTFTISRSGTNLPAQTVRYRTVSVSAIAGQHFTDKSGTLSFDADETSKSVDVMENVDNVSEQYHYQYQSTNRYYRFEVTDNEGYYLAHVNREISYGNSYKLLTDKMNSSVTDLVYFNGTSFNSNLSSSKYIDVSFTPPSNWVNSSGYVTIDDSYTYQYRPAVVSTSDLITNTNTTRTYLNAMGAKIYATVCFTMKEEEDGYQYVQIVEGDANAAYDTGADPDPTKNPTDYVNAPSNSIYKTCFELYQPGDDPYPNPGKQFFPHRYDYHNRTEGNQSSSHTEFYLADGYMYQQRFRSSSYRASNSGSVVISPTVEYITTRFDCAGKNDDTWGYKDFFVRMTLCDTQKPTKLADPVVSGGKHAYGNTVYVSVPFNEIVKVSGTPTLTTTWGTLSYFAGNNTNVLTFSGPITAIPGTQLTVNSLSGTIQDLMGNSFNTATAINKSYSYTVETPWSGSGNSENDPYLINNASQLECLAKMVDNGNEYSGTFFKLCADLAYDSTIVNNFTSIGGYGNPFKGTFDGDGHTISGINIEKNGNTNDDTNQGLFGFISTNAVVKNIILSDAIISGYQYIGGIAGYQSGGTITNCLVIESCVTYQNGVSAGVIAGYSSSTNNTNNYYYSCILNSYTTSNIYTLTPSTDVLLPERSGTTFNTSYAVYDNGVTYNGVEYYTGVSTVTLSYNGEVPANHFVKYAASTSDGDITASKIEGNILSMPFANTQVTVSAILPFVSYVDFDGVMQQCIDYTLIESSNNTVELGAQSRNKWYVVNGNVTINAKLLFLDATSNIILCDEDSLTINNNNGLCIMGNTLKFFGQAQGTGTLNTNNTIKCDKLYINGVVFNATQDQTDYAIYPTDAITIGYSNAATRITATNYYRSIHIFQVKDGQAFTDGNGHVIKGTYSAGFNQLFDTIDGRTLQPACILTLPDGVAATGEGVALDGNTTYFAAGNTVTLSASSGYRLTDVTFTPEGGTATAATDNGDYTWSFTMPTANTSVSATISEIPISYTITYDLAGGSVSPANPATYNIETPDFTLNNPRRVGYAFAGWTGTGLSEPTQTVTIAQGSMGDRSYTATWTDVWGMADGANGTELHPYIITTTVGLDLLAMWVNANEGFSEQYFELGNDIAYNPNVLDANGENYTVIGRAVLDGLVLTRYPFRGVFDGKGHTISGIRINKADGNYLGLFGIVERGKVRNVVLSDVVINGGSYIGGIVGYLSISDNLVEDCLVKNSTISGGSNTGAILGYVNSNDTPIYNNLYSNVTIGGAKTGIGVGSGSAHYDISLGNGAVAANTILCGTLIQISPKAIATYHDDNYYLVGATITLEAEGYNVDGGYHVSDANNNSIPLIGDNSFIMPASDVSVTCAFNIVPCEGEGTAEKPWVIRYCSQLDALARDVNNGTSYSGKFFKLGADITYPHTTDWDDVTSTENNFTPIGNIGNEDNSFKGHFDGDGHTISGIRIYGNNLNYQGLFGYIDHDSISNVTLNDARITGCHNVGGIVGYSNHSDIENCHVTSTVAIHSINYEACNHGGIVGYVNYGTVNACTSSASLTSNGVTSNSKGGIFGYSQYGSINNCFAIGVNVSGSDFLGAIGGFYYELQSLSLNYYSACSVNDGSNTISTYIGVGRIGDINMGAQQCYSVTLPAALATTSNSYVVNHKGIRYALPAMNVTIVPSYTEGYTITSATYNDGSDHNIEPDNGVYTFQMPAADVTVSVVWNIDIASLWSGDGTSPYNPYVITTCAGLDALSIRSKNNQTNYDQYYKLGADITYPHATAWDDASSTENNFMAIQSFRGSFDGDGHTVSGIRIYQKESYYQGLFGLTNNSSNYFKNIILSDARITGNNYVGGIIGSGAYNVQVQNCHVTNTVAIHAVSNNASYHGGIAGQTSGAGLEYCTSSAVITMAKGISGCMYYGGIVGDNMSGNIQNCLALNVTIDGGAQSSGVIVGKQVNLGLSNNFYYDCTMGARIYNIGTVEGDIISNNGAYPATPVRRTINGYGDTNGGWAFIASPMSNDVTPYHVQNLIATPETDYDLYRYDPTADLEWQNYKAHREYFHIERSSGYLFASREDVTLTFLGKPLQTETYYKHLNTGYHLIGNPTSETMYLNKPYYKMNDEGTGVEIVENYAENPIPPCTGVVVEATSNSEEFLFSRTAPEMATGNNGNLQIALSQANTRGNTVMDKAIVSFNEGCQLGKFYFMEQDANIYLPQGGEDYAIAFSEGQGEMPLNFKARKNGTYTLTVNPEGVEMAYLHLIDNMTGADVDLLASNDGDARIDSVESSICVSTYTFTAKTSDYASRFKLVFRAQEVGPSTGSGTDEAFAYINNGNIIITDADADATLQIVDMAGRVVISDGGRTRCIPTGNLPAGVYVLRLIDGKDVKTQKIVIQ